MLYSSAKVYWTIYYKGSKEVGHSDYLSTFKELADELNVLRLCKKANDCCMNIDVTFYPSCIFDGCVTILGAL